ncbi:hypothetical protein [Neobacillus dielmonensis]|uniref:hypothetical protein n=1 Tax=Neobacillus dielmonensis TaxID=1347369 RepID=UPI0005AB25B5|nr:hypothetical protein [Neobacillus dielmonensis]
MAQKKTDTATAAEERTNPAVEEAITTSRFVNTFWDQYELSRDRAEKIRENREEAYLNVIREVAKFNKQYRKTIAGLYQQTRKTNKEVVDEVLQRINRGKEDSLGEATQANSREALKKQITEVSGQLEKIALTPIKSVFQIADQVEETFEKTVASNLEFSRQRRNAWKQVRKEYVKVARDLHISMVERGRNGVKELVKTK